MKYFFLLHSPHVYCSVNKGKNGYLLRKNQTSDHLAYYESLQRYRRTKGQSDSKIIINYISKTFAYDINEKNLYSFVSNVAG